MSQFYNCSLRTIDLNIILLCQVYFSFKYRNNLKKWPGLIKMAGDNITGSSNPAYHASRGQKSQMTTTAMSHGDFFGNSLIWTQN